MCPIVVIPDIARTWLWWAGVLREGGEVQLADDAMKMAGGYIICANCPWPEHLPGYCKAGAT